jgi:hypothetical protein
VRNGELRTSLFDLTRRQVLFEQARPGGLSWMRLRRSLGEADPNKIDVRALANREQNAQFFVEQVRQRILEPPEPAPDSEKPVRVGIVLSGPMGFDSGQDTHPIEFENTSEFKIYYFRHHILPPPQLPLMRTRRGMFAAPPRFQEPLDSLVSLIKPLKPRVFDIYNPEQFRRALDAMLEEIARL